MTDPSKSDEQKPSKEVDKINEGGRMADDEPTNGARENATKNKKEEPIGVSSSHAVGYYLKHKINEKLIKGLVGNQSGPVHDAILKKKITSKEDIGGNFEIPYNVGGLKHMNALIDQGSDVNVMPLSIYKRLTDKRPMEIDIRLSLASHSYIYPLGIAEDVLVDVTAKAVIKFDKGTITLRSGKSKMGFHRLPEPLCRIEKGIKNDIEPIYPTITINRLYLMRRTSEVLRKFQEDDSWRTIQPVIASLGWLLEEIHVTWAQWEKKQTRPRLYTDYLEEKLTDHGDGIANHTRRRHITQETASWISRLRQNIRNYGLQRFTDGEYLNHKGLVIIYSQLDNFVLRILSLTDGYDEVFSHLSTIQSLKNEIMVMASLFISFELWYHQSACKRRSCQRFPKLKYAKDHLCSACQMGKNKKESHKSKSEPSTNERLQMLHMDLYGPMRVESINKKSSGPEPHSLTSGHISSGLVPNQDASTSAKPPSKNDLDLLCQPMFD
ncbi:hypothetical protein Tco_0337695 [Tanacetum coccineum]